MKKSIDTALSEEEQRMVLQGLLSRKIWRFYELLAMGTDTTDVVALVWCMGLWALS